MNSMRSLACALVVCLWASVAAAQTTPTLPQGVAFTPSADHASLLVTSYRVELWAGTAAIRTRDVGKPTPAGNEIQFLDPTLFAGLSAGNYNIYVVAVGPGGEGRSAALPLVVDAALTAPAPAGGPRFLYPTTASGTPVPGRIEAENFDNGAEGVSYHDLTPTNYGNSYRSTGVDIESTQDGGAGFNVGWMEPTEWLNYSLFAPAAGAWTVYGRVACACPTGGILYVEIDGTRIGQLTVPNTNGWQTWQTVTGPRIPLSAGAHILRLVAGAGNYVGNVNWFEIR